MAAARLVFLLASIGFCSAGFLPRLSPGPTRSLRWPARMLQLTDDKIQSGTLQQKETKSYLKSSDPAVLGCVRECEAKGDSLQCQDMFDASLVFSECEAGCFNVTAYNCGPKLITPPLTTQPTPESLYPANLTRIPLIDAESAESDLLTSSLSEIFAEFQKAKNSVVLLPSLFAPTSSVPISPELLISEKKDRIPSQMLGLLSAQPSPSIASRWANASPVERSSQPGEIKWFLAPSVPFSR